MKLAVLALALFGAVAHGGDAASGRALAAGKKLAVGMDDTVSAATDDVPDSVADDSHSGVGMDDEASSGPVGDDTTQTQSSKNKKKVTSSDDDDSSDKKKTTSSDDDSSDNKHKKKKVTTTTTTAPTVFPTYAPSTNATAEAEGESYYEVAIKLEESEVIQTFLTKNGIALDDPNITNYIPASMILKVWPKRVARNVGPQALGGKIGFSLESRKDGTEAYAAYLIVMDLASGTIVGIHPQLANRSYNAFKLWDHEHLLLAANDRISKKGPVFTWKWNDTRAFPQELGGGRVGNAHDAQRSADGSAYWQPAESLGLYLVDAESGATRYHVNVSSPPNIPQNQPMPDDYNHICIVNEDRTAYLNCRNCNSFTKVDLQTKTVEWRAGGLNGTMTLVDIDGKRFEPGTAEYQSLHNGVASMWSGAHNGEYWGDGEYWLFNNGWSYVMSAAYGHPNSTNHSDANTDDDTALGFRFESSSVMMVKIDEAANTATVEFEYPVERSQIYGDADRMPSGNILSCNWPWREENVPYQWRAFEIERSDAEASANASVDGEAARLAWQLEVMGAPDDPRNGTTMGWLAYSVERWYDAPLVYNVECTVATGTLSFSAHDTFKQYNPKPGFVTISRNDTGEHVVAPTQFHFVPYWRETFVNVTSRALVDGVSYDVVVSNRFGQTTAVSVTC